MHPGHVTIVIRAAGASAHSSKPDLGASAIKAMGRVLVMLEDLEQELIGERRFEGVLERPWVTMNAGMLKGGAAVNMVPDQCELKMGYRPLPGDDPLDVARRVEQRLAALPLPVGTRVVQAHIVLSELESQIAANVARKEKQANSITDALIAQTRLIRQAIPA